MERAKILYRLVILVCVFIFAAIVVNSGLNPVEMTSTFAMAGLFGSLAITKEADTSGVVVFDLILEDFSGGAILDRTRLSSTDEIKAGSLLYITGGVAEIVKTVEAITGGSATDIRVAKGHQFVVGNHITLGTSVHAETLTAIDATGASYDVLTIGTTLGSSPDTGTVIYEAAAQTSSNTSTLLYTANAILKNTTNVERANNQVSGVVRGTARDAALPCAAGSLHKAALSLIRFV
jgi:hypothetical protein